MQPCQIFVCGFLEFCEALLECRIAVQNWFNVLRESLLPSRMGCEQPMRGTGCIKASRPFLLMRRLGQLLARCLEVCIFNRPQRNFRWLPTRGLGRHALLVVPPRQ